MCGIVGFIGKGNTAKILLDGLETLEYRGYDSAGISILQQNKIIKTTKVTGRVEHLRKELKESLLSELEPSGSTLETVSLNQGRAEQDVQEYGDASTGLDIAKMAKKHAESGALHQSRHDGVGSEVGIGHTRWATHGKVSKRNSHPHLDNDEKFAIVHNGIIENYQEIKELLQKHGYKFYSETDSEVIPNLMSFNYKKLRNVEKAFIATIQSLHGAYAIVMTTTCDTDTLYAAKLSSPLAVGVTENNSYIGSDATPIISHTNQIVFLEDNEIALVKGGSYVILNSLNEKIVNRPTEIVELIEAIPDIGKYDDFMSKEIHESPQTVRSALQGRLKIDEELIKLGGLDLVQNQLAHIDRIIIIACGTSYYAGLVGEYLIEEIAGIPVEVHQASEFRYRKEPLSRSTAVLAISQSGETADTIAGLNKIDGTGILKLGIVNAPGSTISRITDAGIYCHAGAERAVASTKAFVAQVTVLALLALYLSKNYKNFTELTHALNDLPKQLEKVLDLEEKIKLIAKKYSHHRSFLYIGRRYAYPVALEGALKLKEISYIHAEGFAGGELKHGPLALIDKDLPTFAIVLSNDLQGKSASNIQEIHARGGPIIAIVDDVESEAAKLAAAVINIPKIAEPLQPILCAVVTHLFAYHVAKVLDREIDKPRNLAKSVTVE